ncbi:type II inositol 1,4,5-trisphosphate 5-phosphatase-like isoform X2 [Oratosquilla oratoria]|uniref:type II inositol 1,4,5-trisphosphate 5-phosphatase-like isoform X2 n=1 Tax=Oratosquilla oratoria TaxID=337810 RepID=UPI003F764CBA
MELVPYVQEKLKLQHKLTAVVEAGLVQDFVKTTRVIALVEGGQGGGEQAIIIFQTARIPVHSAIDLSVEQAFAVDGSLRCELDVATDVLVNISCGKVRLLFEMPFGSRTNTFVSEVLRAAEVVSKRRGGPPNFTWLQDYLPNSNTGTSNTQQQGSSGNGSGNNSCGRDLSSEDDLLLTDSGEFKENAEVSVGHSEFYARSSSQQSLELSKASSLTSSGEHENDPFPDVGVNRQNIAHGLSPTPIAARESHIRHQMALREDAYTNVHKFTVFLGTWNVNGQPAMIGLKEWLSIDEDPPDVYAIGFQELDLSSEAFLFNTSPQEQDWQNVVLSSVHPKAKYRKVKLIRLVGMMLMVLVQERHYAYVREVSFDTVGTGIMGKMGNKGAVAVRMDLHNTSICFVNAHLAAHVEEYDRRNEDYDSIIARTSFTSHKNINSPPKSIKDHDHIYFFGDLNYRINPGNYNIKEMIELGQYDILLKNDQLTQQRNIERVFHGFTEGEITFRPSYKYALNSDEWDGSEKARQPSWCDRILWQGEGIKQLSYRSHPQLKISDHKPVSALFMADIKVVDSRSYRKIYEEVMKKLDKLENEFLPQVAVDTTEIIFEPVKFLQPQTKYLTIANTGQVPVQFEFIKKLNDSTYCKQWLNIRPYINFIMPGDKCDISLEVLVDKRTAAQLNAGLDKLYDILVLHLEGGKDLFITINGDYERSCFGSSIEALVHMNIPFKEVPIAKLIDLESPQPKEQIEMPYAVPKELWYLVNHLHSHALQIEGLFTTPGLHKEIIEIRNSLDSGVVGDFLPGSVHSVAEALLLFLEALPEPVIPYILYQRALDSTPNFALCKEVIAALPVYHRNVFSYLMAFLKELLKHSHDNNLDARTLASVFGSILIRERQTRNERRATQQSAIERKKQTFVHHFLVNE